MLRKSLTVIICGLTILSAVPPAIAVHNKPNFICHERPGQNHADAVGRNAKGEITFVIHYRDRTCSFDHPKG